MTSNNNNRTQLCCLHFFPSSLVLVAALWESTFTQGCMNRVVYGLHCARVLACKTNTVSVAPLFPLVGSSPPAPDKKQLMYALPRQNYTTPPKTRNYPVWDSRWTQVEYGTEDGVEMAEA